MSDKPGNSRRRIILWCAIVIVLCLCAILSLNGCRRPDDILEPNDDFEHATRLVVGQAVTARANQGNDDFFAIHAEAGQTIVFRLQSLGREDCPAFSVFGPDKEVLYRDYFSFCGPRHAEIQAEGVISADIKDFGYELRLPADVSGTYYLLIRERHQADNIFPFSWDYRLIATIDSVTATPAPTPTATPLLPNLRSFTDDAGNVVNLPVAPQRIVSISPEITEILVALGAFEKIVGIDNFSSWPSARAPIPRLGEPFLLGDWIRPEIGIDTDAVVALRPDLVIADGRTCARVSTSVPRPPGRILPPFPDLAWAGIPTVYLNPMVGVTGAPKLIRSLGAIVGESDKANELVASHEKRKQAVVERVQVLPKVHVLLAQIYRSGPLLMPGILVAQDDRLNELIQLAGGVNVFTSSPEDTATINRLKELGRTELFLEPFIAKNPEVILVVGALDEMRTSRPGWEKVEAVQKGRVYAIGEMTPLTVIDRLEEISRLLHPVIPTR